MSAPGQTIRVRIAGAKEASYTVVVEPGALRHAGALIRKHTSGRICVVTNERVWGHHGAAFQRGLGAEKAVVVTIPEGEQNKTLAAVETIAEELIRARADRGAIIVSLGGGVIGDIAGFAAAIYLRGVEYVHIPTTLLAQIDSSIGGKTGVNLRAGKNLIGSFHHPKLVIIDPEVLQTLSERELRAGLFEAIKTGVIRNHLLFEFLEQHEADVLAADAAALTRVIHDCLAVKAKVVSEDEREHGMRRILNFGHTVGHVLEAETSYRHFLHGEAVAWGMRIATRIAEEREMIRGADAARIHSLVMSYGPVPPLVHLEPESLATRLHADKKTRDGVVHFILPLKIGEVKVVTDVAVSSVLSAISSFLA